MNIINKYITYVFHIYIGRGKMNIYEYNNYASYLDSIIKHGSWGIQSQIAKAANCQASYLSQVIRGKAHLTSDHVIGIATFLKLSTDETEFFLKLVEHEKAGPLLKKFMQERLNEMKQIRNDLAVRYQVPSLADSEAQVCYYSSWHWSAIHILVSAGFNTLDRLSRRILLPMEVIRSTLLGLEQMGLIKQKNGTWSELNKSIHLPNGSHLTGLNHWNWRQRAIQDAQFQNNTSLHYSSVQSLSHSDLQKIKALMLQLLDQSRNIIKNSPGEDGFCLNCDFFII